MDNVSTFSVNTDNMPFYNTQGAALFYLHANGEHFYHYDGTPLAYLHNNEFVVSYTGQYLGWVYNGSIIDFRDGAYAFFSPLSEGGPIRPTKKSRPSRATRLSRPSKEPRANRPSRPSKVMLWSDNSDMSFFAA